jgi:hypothetical protein
VSFSDEAFMSLNEAKGYLGIQSSETESDLLISDLVGAVSAYIINAIDRPLAIKRYEETLVLREANFARVNQAYPIQSVERVSLNERPLEPFEWVFDPFRIHLTKGPKSGTLVICYEAGYLALPFDLKQAALKLLEIWYRQKGTQSLVASQSLHGDTISFKPSPLLSDIQALLNPYRRVA